MTLPAEFIALLWQQNGGYTSGFAYPMTEPISWADDHVPLDELAGIVTDSTHEGVHNVLLTESVTPEWGLPPHQVLLSGDGHWWITLDYREGEPPCVTWLDVELGEDIRIAGSFAEFLEGLVPASTFETSGDIGDPLAWRPELMRFSIEQDPGIQHGERHLLLEQGADAEGWTLSRLRIPESWRVTSIGFEGQDLRLTLSDGRRFELNAEKLGALSFELLDGAPSSERAVDRIWRDHCQR